MWQKLAQNILLTQVYVSFKYNTTTRVIQYHVQYNYDSQIPINTELNLVQSLLYRLSPNIKQVIEYLNTVFVNQVIGDTAAV